MNRPDISKLRKNRSIHMKIGMLLSLSFMVLAFNWTTYSNDSLLDNEFLPVTTEAVEVIRTPRENPPEPPPVMVEPSSEIEPIEEPEFDPEPIVEQLETKPLEDVFTKVTKPAPPVAKPRPKEKPAPPVIVEPELDIPEIFSVVEEMPRFPGCESEDMTKQEKRKCAEKALLQFIGKNVRYPEMARDNQVEGTVVMSFVVNEDGSISDIKIARDIGAGCGRETTRVIKKMPKWIPGKQIGRPVKVHFNLPVKFKLE
ncbi:MAG: energy transducer TonB [Saprospiraceae bacterium]